MDEDIDVVFVDHDPLARKLKGDDGKGFEVHIDLPLQLVQLLQRQQQRLKPGSILSLIRIPQGLDGLVDTEESLVLDRVPDGLRRTSDHQHGERDEPHEGGGP